MAKKKELNKEMTEEEFDKKIKEVEESEELVQETEDTTTYTKEQLEDDSNEFFPNGPSIGQIEEWKSLYNDEVYMTDFENNDIFIWRPIRRSEYKNIFKVEGSDAYYREEKITTTCLLWPKNKSALLRTHGKAGIPTILSELIMEKSGYNPHTTSVKL